MSRPVAPGIAHGHQHAEAFCLMTYQTDDAQLTERIWNSRDGVTPFVVRSTDGREMTHVRWGEDAYLPDYLPPPGSRVFITLSRERAAELAAERVEQYWEHPEYPMSSMFADKAAAVARVAEDLWHNGWEPRVVTVRPDGTFER